MRVEASTNRVAKLGGDVPEAARIRTAGVVGGITVRALLLARCLGSVPNARTGGRADVRRVDERALLAAFSAEGVPEAQGVGGARCCVGVGIGAAGDADFAGVEPHAAGERGTGVDFGLVLEGRAAAGRDALGQGGRPHAVGILDAGALSGVLGKAGEIAERLGRIGVDALDGVLLSVETAVVDGATKISASTALSERQVRALAAALEVDPFANTSCCADSLITDALTGGSTRSNTAVPHAVGGGGIASGFVVEAETALERASLRGIVVDASSGLGLALLGGGDA